MSQERQKDINSPYNFNNSPQTTLNLKEYEKTGKIDRENPVKSKNADDSNDNSNELIDIEKYKPDITSERNSSVSMLLFFYLATKVESL